MPTVGEQLRSAREARGWSVAQVSEQTKIMSKHLIDLETGRFEGFSAPVYIKGFVRSYAALLKLDVDRVMADLDQELSRTEKFAEPPSLTGPRRGPLDFLTLWLSRLNWRFVLPVVGLLLLALLARSGYRLWHDQRTKDPLATLGPGLYQPTNPPTGDTLPLPSAAPRR